MRIKTMSYMSKSRIEKEQENKPGESKSKEIINIKADTNKR